MDTPRKPSELLKKRRTLLFWAAKTPILELLYHKGKILKRSATFESAFSNTD
jgi:hypothetical protein